MTFEKLNKEQQLAANFGDGICAVIAVPGSGKTKTMMERIGLLVNKHGISPENILGLTFTRNAAEEMRSRLIPVLGDMASRVHLATIHSFCNYLLREEGQSFDILYGKEQIIFIKEILKKLKINDVSVGSAIREISLAKNNLITAHEFFELYGNDKAMKRIGKVYDDYEHRKKAGMLKDFDDLLYDAFRTLRDLKHVRKKYQDTFLHLLVDEFQDTNPLQIEIFKLLISEDNEDYSSSFWVAGDDAQSIYSFTGASVGNILNFKNTFPEAEQIIMAINYRSSGKILKACQNLIKNNLRQIHKELITQNPDGDDVIVLESSNEETEAMQVIMEIQDLVERQSYKYADIVVLYRANFQSRVLEEACLKHKMPYHITNGMNFYDRFEIKILLDYLRFITDPDSEAGNIALASIINIPNRYIGRKFVNDLEKKAVENNRHLYEQLKSMRIKIPYIRRSVKEFTEFIEHIISCSDDMTPAEMIDLIRVSLDYDRKITDTDIPQPDDSRIQNIDQLQMAAGRFKEVKAFLSYTETFEDARMVNNDEGVNLMTIHKAKGLEFGVVFVVGLVEGILPNKNCENLEEERRVAFVGMSRAMHLLYLSHSQTYLGQAATKSIFIDESMDAVNSKTTQTAA